MDDVNKKKLQNNNIIIDVVADVICPWCYIGCQIIKKVLDKDIYNNVKFNWIPFFLKSSIPLSGQNRSDYLINKFGSKYYLIEDNIKKFASINNISINLEKIEVMPNTQELHNIIVSENKINMNLKLAEEIMKKIFVYGIDFTQRLEINKIINKYKIQDLNYKEKFNNKYSDIEGVPLFIFNNKWKISGVQNYKIFESVLELCLLDLNR